MGEVKSRATSHSCQYVSEFNDVFTSDGKILFCQTWGKASVTQQHSQVTQYLSGSKHIVTVGGLKDWPTRQSLIDESSTSFSSGPSKFATLQSNCVCRHTNS
jgi:hypothetical protein